MKKTTMDIPDALAESGFRIAQDIVKGGKIIKIYFDGTLCRLARIEEDAARKVAAYQAILNDIYKVQSYLSLACEIARDNFNTGRLVEKFDFNSKDQVICSSLYHSAVTLYGKCFTQAQGRSVKLEESQIRKRLTDDQVATHEKLLKLRHNWAAHGGLSDHESICGIMAFLPDGRARTLYVATTTGFPSPADLEDFLSLCEPMKSMIEDYKKKHEDKVFKGKDIQSHLADLQENSELLLFVEDS